jgi:co-chaperonin GroES (HSP10)
MKPLNDNLLVAEIKEDQTKTTEGGIILTQPLDEVRGSKAGLVLAVGPDVKNVSKGDTIYLKWSEGIIINVDGNEAALVPEEAVKAIK